MEMVQPSIIDEIIKTSALRDKRIHIYGVLEMDGALEVQHYMQRIYDMDKINKNTDKKITLIINSLGGNIYSGNMIIGMMNFLQSEGYEITGIVQGFAFSMAFDILTACDIRLGYSFSEYLLHQTQCGLPYGALVQGERELKYLKKQWEKAVKLYTDKTLITREQIETMYENSKDWWMSCEEALELGVIDKILK